MSENEERAEGLEDEILEAPEAVEPDLEPEEQDDPEPEALEPEDDEDDDRTEGLDEEDGPPVLSAKLSVVLGQAYSQADIFTQQEVTAWLDQADPKGDSSRDLKDVPKYVKQLLDRAPLDPGRDTPTRPDDPEYTEQEYYPTAEDDDVEPEPEETSEPRVDLEKDEDEKKFASVDRDMLETTISATVKAAIEAALGATRGRDKD